MTSAARSPRPATFPAPPFSGVGTFTDYSSSPQGPIHPAVELYSHGAIGGAVRHTRSAWDGAAKTISKQNPALSVASFLVEGLQVSPQSQPVCPQAGLISDATAQAQAVATAAGLSAGPILQHVHCRSAHTAGFVSAGDFSAGSAVASSAGFGPCQLPALGLSYPPSSIYQVASLAVPVPA